MTEEQIASLQHRIMEYERHDMAAPAGREVLPRLLEERKRLLEALCGLRDRGCWSSAAGEDCPICLAAEAAISFAEERAVRDIPGRSEPHQGVLQPPQGKMLLSGPSGGRVDAVDSKSTALQSENGLFQ